MLVKHIRINTGPHFDAPLSRKAAELLVSDPKRVASHAFHPFLAFSKSWTRFKKAGGPAVAPKERPIRSACRRDSYIFSAYRRSMLPAFEARLASDSLTENVLAYRSIAVPGENKRKCNIHFAREAFKIIKSKGDCLVIALDIKSFFESLDHGRIKKVWTDLLHVARLPDDHYAIFCAVTRYAYVDRVKAFKILGILEEIIVKGETRDRYTVPKDQMPPQLCTGAEFREKIAPEIRIHSELFGIPQGTAISDLLANLYMLDFDKVIKEAADKVGGTYFRYSDDILLILPPGVDIPEWRLLLESTLSTQGPELHFKHEKTSIHRFNKSQCGVQKCELLEGKHGKHGFEYLGFRFDGQHIFIRNGTLSSVYRRIAGSAKRLAFMHVSKNKGASLSELQKTFPYGVLWERYGNTRLSEKTGGDLERKQTFRSYVLRSKVSFAKEPNGIARQIARQRKLIYRRANLELTRMYKRKP